MAHLVIPATRHFLDVLLATCRSAVRYAEALFTRELDAGLRTDDAVMAANAAVNLGLIYQREQREPELSGLAPAFATIAASERLGTEVRAVQPCELHGASLYER